ncbi:MAG TPA: SpoIID/LytB domain-containing protein [Gaiellaceae bacterium]|nr:SpoIID/LytB domain-containing protein [Gaiellaceae bacterium]
MPRPFVGRLALALVLACAAAAATAAQASASTVLVLTGRGWGHGVGMSQWGAYGYARHGWGYRRILAHYYPGTRLATAGEPRVRVLLKEDASVVTVGCAAPFRAVDGRGRGHPLPAGTYGVGPRLVLPVVRRRIRASRRHSPHAAFRLVGRALPGPVVLECDTAPLLVDGRAYHGSVVLRSAGGRLSAVNSLPLDTYLRGVVGAEMPSRWAMAALEAQAVAARSYAVATLHPDQPWDAYADERSQMYLGLAAESPRTDRAVRATRGQVLTWNGAVATTYYSSSSGGRTADVHDLWPGAGDLPYLRPVPDPYDAASPHHEWGPVAFTAERLAAKLGLDAPVAAMHVERGPSWRAEAVDVTLASGGTRRLTGQEVANALGLRSTWFRVGELSLTASRARVRFGHGVRLDARASVRDAVLQARDGEGPWTTVRAVRGAARLRLRPDGSSAYRLVAPGVAGPELAVAVAPRVQARPLGRTLLGGTVLPRTDGAVTVWRLEHGAWTLVARPRLDPRGRFRSPLRLRAGSYRVRVAGDARLAAAELRLRVTKRLLASLRRR